MPPLSGLFRCKSIAEDGDFGEEFHVAEFWVANRQEQPWLGAVEDCLSLVVPAGYGLVVGRTYRLTLDEAPDQ
jgi:hypothetical protein